MKLSYVKISKEAMKEELNILKKNNTWIIVQLPKNKKNSWDVNGFIELSIIAKAP
jgi:hypothetical protein